jgi:ABC-type branched-subunit amino acid transport system substrate-binding protein
VQFITYDDGYEPQRALANAKRLVEQDKVFAIVNPLGTANNLAMRDYLNQNKVPQLFVATGATSSARTRRSSRTRPAGSPRTRPSRRSTRNT